MSSLKERTAAAAAAAVQKKTVEAMGLKYESRGMMGGDALRVQDAREHGGNQRAAPLMIALCTYDPETGQQVWNPNDLLDIEAIGRLPIEVMDALAEAAAEVSGLLGKADSPETKSSPSTSPASSEGAPSTS